MKHFSYQEFEVGIPGWERIRFILKGNQALLIQKCEFLTIMIAVFTFENESAALGAMISLNGKSSIKSKTTKVDTSNPFFNPS